MRTSVFVQGPKGAQEPRYRPQRWSISAVGSVVVLAGTLGGCSASDSAPSVQGASSSVQAGDLGDQVEAFNKQFPNEGASVGWYSKGCPIDPESEVGKLFDSSAKGWGSMGGGPYTLRDTSADTVDENLGFYVLNCRIPDGPELKVYSVAGDELRAAMARESAWLSEKGVKIAVEVDQNEGEMGTLCRVYDDGDDGSSCAYIMDTGGATAVVDTSVMDSTPFEGYVARALQVILANTGRLTSLGWTPVESASYEPCHLLGGQGVADLVGVPEMSSNGTGESADKGVVDWEILDTCSWDTDTDPYTYVYYSVKRFAGDGEYGPEELLASYDEQDVTRIDERTFVHDSGTQIELLNLREDGVLVVVEVGTTDNWADTSPYSDIEAAQIILDTISTNL